ncbi:class II fructose-bisphosphatase [candidate division GN15 bacterium]|nr:class II fructose-bisphosphatase [candidate division GN15 bacterium]
MDRNLALELIRVTEAAALAAARWMGKGNASAADTAAIAAMHHNLTSIHFQGTVVLGEGDPEHAPALFAGEKIGDSTGAVTDKVDLALDALESTRSVAFGRLNAMSIAVAADPDSFFVPPTLYMEKIAVGAAAADVVDLNAPIEENLSQIARVKGYSISDLTVAILDRERHHELIEVVRRTGARIHLIPDGDVAASIAAAMEGTGIDLVVGSGGAVPGVLAAGALRCIGGQLLARLAPTTSDEAEAARKAGLADINHVYTARDLVRGDNIMFAATGVTDGDMLNGVRYRPDGATTHSLVMRSRTGTRRMIVTEHYFDEGPDY